MHGAKLNIARARVSLLEKVPHILQEEQRRREEEWEQQKLQMREEEERRQQQIKMEGMAEGSIIFGHRLGQLKACRINKMIFNCSLSS